MTTANTLLDIATQAKARRAELMGEIKDLDRVLAALDIATVGVQKKQGVPKGTKRSAESRERMAAAQRASWAKRNGTATTTSPVAEPIAVQG